MGQVVACVASVTFPFFENPWQSLGNALWPRFRTKPASGHFRVVGIALQPANNGAHCGVQCVSSKRAFPYHNNAPMLPPESIDLPPVTNHIRTELPVPEFKARLRYGR
jgi:hypothetical protein